MQDENDVKFKILILLVTSLPAITCLATENPFHYHWSTWGVHTPPTFSISNNNCNPKETN